jgi:hypothetical protein
MLTCQDMSPFGKPAIPLSIFKGAHGNGGKPEGAHGQKSRRTASTTRPDDWPDAFAKGTMCVGPPVMVGGREAWRVNGSVGSTQTVPCLFLTPFEKPLMQPARQRES